MILRFLLVVMIVLGNFGVHAVGVDELQLEDPAKEAEARALFKQYRCLVCQNQSIEDSDAELAADLRAIIREQIAVGKTPEQIEEFLVSRYGDWVLLTPKLTGLTLLLWLFPLILLLIGFILALYAFKRREPKKTNETPGLSDEQQRALDEFRS